MFARLLPASTILPALLCLVGCIEPPDDPNLAKRLDGGTDFAGVDLIGVDLTGIVLPGQLDVQPSALQTLTVNLGQTPPTVVFTATLDGQPVSAAWAVDRGEIGTVPTAPASAATFTPSANGAGLVQVSAGFDGQTVTRQVWVQIAAQQNGADPSDPAQAQQTPANPAAPTAGGGVGGVGGEGLGGAVASQTTLNALATPTGNAAGNGFTILYPYNDTVWPRGLNAPLVMWRWNTNDADAIQLELSTTSGSFTWKGTFARPAILSSTGGAFVRHPIPQNIWKMATNSAGGPMMAGGVDKLTLKLTVARAGVGYGPLTQAWIIAPARLTGTIYYNSYGTQYAKQDATAVGGDGKFGGAVLSIRVGDTAPRLAAGANGGDAQCRVCHSVSANGARFVSQWGDAGYAKSSAYSVSTAGITEQLMTNDATFPGMYPDGTIALTKSGKLLPLPNDAAALAISGLTAVATDLGTPTFSPSGLLAAFNPIAGALANAKQKLVVMAFNKANGAFSGPVVVVDDTGQPAERRPGWPAFLPDSKSVVFHHQSVAGSDGNNDGALWTRAGAKAQIYWTNVTDATKVTRLDKLNGVGYLPQLTSPVSLSCTSIQGGTPQVGGIDASHQDDVNLNYEPTALPVGAGGYAWVVFTSRRMYGNVATIPPFCSDPRGVDLVTHITTKKLWVAAIDINAAPGTDASHPAFYLPAQELLAGNSRGFWVLDPCRADGSTCETGDQCCNGYCQPNGQGGALVCSNVPPSSMCSKPQEKCVNSADCCDKTNVCINGFCAQTTVN